MDVTSLLDRLEGYYSLGDLQGQTMPLQNWPQVQERGGMTESEPSDDSTEAGEAAETENVISANHEPLTVVRYLSFYTLEQPREIMCYPGFTFLFKATAGIIH
jgi:hypothetical protein